MLAFEYEFNLRQANLLSWEKLMECLVSMLSTEDSVCVDKIKIEADWGDEDEFSQSQ